MSRPPSSVEATSDHDATAVRPPRSAAPPRAEVLIAPDVAAAFRRYCDALETQQVRIGSVAAPVELDMSLKVPLLQLKPLEVRALEELPRPTTRDALAESTLAATENNPLKGGGV